MFPSIISLCICLCTVQDRAARWHVETPNQTIAQCTLESLDAKGLLKVRDDAELREVARFFELRRSDAILPPVPLRNFVCLNNGDRLPLDPDASAVLDKSRLQVWPAQSLPELRAKGVSLYVPNVAMLFWSVPDGVEDAHRYFAQLEHAPRKRDVVYLQNGDRLEGTLVSISGKEGCVATIDGRRVQTPWSKLAGVAWGTERQARLKTKNPYWRAVLDGGARVNFLDARFDDKTRRWSAVTQFGVTLDLPESAVLALDRRQGDAVDLADLTPARYEAKPYLGITWPLVKNASALERALQLGENTYEHGLGVHAACRIEFALNGGYQRFLCTVGIDDAARRGRARVALELDGKRIELNDGKELTSQTAPIPVSLDVSKARTLTLIVEHGTFGDVQAHVNFAKARLIKKD